MARRLVPMTAVILGLAAAGSVARAGPAADAPRLVEDWTALDGACRGGRGDDPATHAACARRGALDRRLDASGRCDGRPGDAGYQRVRRPCAGASR